jgi:hypothetical protein
MTSRGADIKMAAEETNRHGAMGMLVPPLSVCVAFYG